MSMKFEVYGEDFKKAVDRALVVLPRKTSVLMLEKLMIMVENGNILIKTTDIDSFLTIRVDGYPIEDGFVYIDKDDIKLIYNLKGLVTCEAANGMFTIKNNKKKSSVNYNKEMEIDDYPKFPDMRDAEKFMETDGKDFIDTLKKLSVSLKDENADKKMACYSFEGKSNRMATLDGHRITVRKLDDFLIEENVIVPGFIFKHLKKIIEVKNIDSITAVLDEKRRYIEFYGNDFEYIVRLLDAPNWFDIDKLFGSDSDYDYMIVLDSKELDMTTKEYKKNRKAIGKRPMILEYSKENELTTSFTTMRYSTTDRYDVFEINDDNANIRCGLDPEYVNDSMQLFDGYVDIHINKNGNKGCVITPVIIKDSKDKYASLLLPCNLA